MMTKREAATQAICIGLSTFVGVTSVFSAMMAFGIARNTADPALSRWLGVAALSLCVMAFYKGRKSPVWTAIVTIGFLAVNAILVSQAMSGEM